MNAEEAPIRRDPLFKGATRPAMLFGVPLMPLALAIAAPSIIGMYGALFINNKLMLLGLLSIPIIAVMRAMIAKDDQQFRLLWLKWRFRLGRGASTRFWRASTYAPLCYRREKKTLSGYQDSPPIFLGKTNRSAGKEK